MSSGVGAAARGALLVGRESAIAELDEVLTRAADGTGGLVLVEGEAGIGKTALAAEASERAAARGFAVRWGRCLEADGPPPYWPWAQMLEAQLDPGADVSVVGDAGAALTTVAPVLATRLGGGALTGGADRFALFAELRDFWKRAAAKRPLLLVIDDLHWADVASVLLLAHLAPAMRDRPLVALATARPPETTDERLVGALAEVRHARPLVVTLAGLEKGALAELVRDAGFEDDPSLVELLATRTQGNPFFVTELLRLLRSGKPTADARARVLATEVPQQVADVLLRRVARVPARTAEVLGAAAVLGNSGAVVLLAATAGLSIGETLQRLGAAVAAGLIAEDAGRWRFAHALVRDTLYASLPVAARHRLHHRAAVALTESGDGPAAELARHALGALPLGDAAQAAALAVAAGRQAMARLAYEEAAEHFERALAARATSYGAQADGAELLLALGEARRSGGDAARAREACAAAAELAGDRTELLSAAALGFADPGADLGIAYRAADVRTVELLEQALALAGPEDSEARALLLARLAAELYFSSESSRSRPLAEEAIATARRVGTPAVLVGALAVHHDAFVVGQASGVEALAGSGEMLRLAEASGDRRGLLIANRARVFDLLAAGDLAGVDGAIGAFRRVAEELRVPAHLWWIGLWRAMRAMLEGRHADAERFALDAYAVGKRPFAALATTNLSILLFFLRHEQGRLRELEPAAQRLAEDVPEIPAATVGLMWMWAELGDHDKAAGLMSRLAADGFVLLRDRNWPASWFQLARAAARLGDRERAQQLYELGRPLAGRCLMVSLGTVCLGSADLGLASLAGALGRHDEADELYRRAEATNARLGARSWLAQARADHAALLAAAGGVERRREVRRLAELARDTASEIGLPRVAEAAAGVLASVRDPAPSDAVFRRDGPVWELAYAGVSVRVADAKGLADIAWMLGRPGEPVHVSELLARQSPTGAVDGAGNAAADVLDSRARREIRARLGELQAEVDDADRANDPERAARAREELDQLVDALASAVGFGGRSRRLGDSAERMRKTVTARIRNSIRRIDRVHPALARHLERSVDTGHWCVYRPEHETAWRL